MVHENNRLKVCPKLGFDFNSLSRGSHECLGLLGAFTNCPVGQYAEPAWARAYNIKNLYVQQQKQDYQQD